MTDHPFPRTDGAAASSVAVAPTPVERPRRPSPTRTRWQPLRLGLTNLYRYDDQEFHFEDGRLLLRGNNGTGKSRVVALTLPFLLDGDTSPHRVEPDGDGAKRIEWNLLLGQHEDRLGYAWMEFGRKDDDGDDRFVTIGCGLRAVAGRGAPTKWFFVTDQRVGDDLSLVADTGQTLTRDRLRQALTDRGEVHDTATAYRRAVDRALFGLGETRYGALVDLLVQLRRPQLSRQLDESLLSEALSEALPPLSAAVVADVAEAFRTLDDERDAVDGLRAAHDATDRFLRAYRGYGAVALRRRVGEVTTSNSRYEETQRTLNAEIATRDEQHAEAERLVLRATELADDADDADTTVRTLEASPEMDRVRELDAARSRETELAALAEDRDRDAERAATELGRREEAQQAAQRAIDASRDRTEEALDRAATTAETIGRADEHGAALASLHDPDASTALGDATAAARRRLDAVADTADEQTRLLRERERAVTQAQMELTTARTLLTQASGDLDAASDAVREADDDTTGARQALADAYGAWASELTELTVADPDEVRDGVRRWDGDGDGPVAPIVDAAAQRALTQVAAAAAALDHERAQLEEQRTGVEAERADVAAGRHAPPPAHPSRDAAGRDTRAGAPLWQLVDWVDAVREDERAGLEAALEAAGLLDAWITPDGRLLDADDAQLLGAGATADGPDLTAVLRPDLADGGPVPVAVVRDVLAAVGSRPDAGVAWVAPDGRYRLGPLTGRHRKDSPEHVGHAARERARQARLEHLDRVLAELAVALDAVADQATDLDDRRARIATERSDAPGAETLRRAIGDLAAARVRAEQLRERVTAAETRVRELHTALDAATEERDVTAADLGLAAWLGRLDELTTAIQDYRVALAGLWPQLGAHQRELAEGRRAADALAQQQDEQHRATEAAAVARRHAREAATRRTTLEDTAGDEVERILARLETARGTAARLRDELAHTHEAHRDAQVQVEVARQRITDLAGQLTDVAEVRARAVERLRQAVVAGLPTVAATSLAEETAPAEPGWAADPAVRGARRMDRELSDVDAGDDRWRRVQGDIHGHFTELEHALLPHTIQPTASLEDDLFVVTAPFQGRTQTVPGLRALLADELSTRQTLLDAREREVLENHLVGEVATQLHELIRAGEGLIAEMNAEIAQRPTSTGMRLRFAWRPREDGPEAFADARRRLLAADDVWSPADRQALGAFLQERIREVREADDTGTWQEHLARALDYRRWHLFVVERQQDGTWVRLTRRTHGTGSGGEKALALTIPQFAAAAAHYRSADPHAPRLIALDEAFVGIDSDMRAKCMDLLTRFDLDVVMTSEREWACYPTVPAIAIYQLSTRPGIDAVGVHRWVWNGQQRLAISEASGEASG